MVLIGHVTKEGSLAGPRALEHLVDCVLHFEGERERTFRTVRALKNRFGATSEVGVFEMREGGLVEVADPSARFVGEARPERRARSCCCAMEGTRPLLVEVQALVAPTEIEHPRRTATGIDRNRLALVLAVLARHAGSACSAADVFVNVAGGVRVDEPGADLAVALAVASAHSGQPLEAGGQAARLLRRGRADRRAALRRPRRPPRRRGPQVRARAGGRARGSRGEDGSRAPARERSPTLCGRRGGGSGACAGLARAPPGSRAA